MDVSGDVRGPEWRKSSYSGGGNDCVEVTFLGTTPAVRDSKDPEGGVIRFETSQWRHILGAAARGELDLG